MEGAAQELDLIWSWRGQHQPPMSYSPMWRWMEREAPTTRSGFGDNKRPVSGRHCGSGDHRLPGLDG